MRIKASRYLPKAKDILSLVTVVQTDYMLQHPLGPIKKKKKRKNVGRDWKEANETRGLIIHDSMRKSNSVIVNYNYTFFLHLGLSLYDIDTYEINSLTVCLNSFLFLK